MKCKILRVFPSGTKEVEEIDIVSFRWSSHRFSYIPIYNSHKYNAWKTLEEDEELVGLEI